ncbi:minor tail protein [Arthrobacter phage Aoka]|nr:minor tail protein [Arthrobacter phage Aoka]
MSDVRRSAGWLADKLTDQDRRLSLVESRKPGLAQSSIEDGAIEEYTADGTFASSVGKQPDGSHVAFPATGPTPAAPVVPTLKASPGLVEVRWSGKFTGDAVSTLDFKHVAVHVGTTPEVDTAPNTQVATIRGELGDVAVLAAEEGMVYVCLVAWTAAGKASAPSAVGAVAVPAPANAELINESLADLDLKYDGVITEAGQLGDRLDTAETDLTASKERLTDAEEDLASAFGQLNTVDARVAAAKQAAIDAAAADATLKKEQAEAAAALEAAEIAQTKADEAEAAALAAAKTYADAQASGAGADALAAAKLDATAKADAAKAAAITAAAADATAKKEQAEANAALDAKAKADAAQAAAIAAAATTAQTKADAAKAAAIAAAATDAQTKADAARDVALAQVAQVIARGTSLTRNGDFEAGADGWSLNSGAAVETGTARSGTKALRMGPNPTVNMGVSSEWVPGSAGRTYYVEMWVRRTGTEVKAQGLGFYVQAKTAAGGTSSPIVGRVDSATISTTGWTKISVTYTVATADTVAVRFAPWIIAGNNTYHFDDFLAVDVTEAQAALTAAAAADAKAVAAQSAAGTAGSNATAALNMAGTKNSAYSSPDPATGTGTTAGDLWRQVNAGKEVIAEWQWSGSTWVKQTVSGSNVSNMDIGYLTAGAATMSQALIDKLVAGTANFQRADIVNLFATSGTLDEAVIDKLWADVVHAYKITTAMLAVGSFDNVIPDPDFTNEELQWGSAVSPYSFPATEGRTGGGALKITPNTSQTGRYSARIPASGAASYRVAVWVKSDVAIPAGGLGLYVNRKLSKSGGAGGAINILKQADGTSAGNDPIAANTWTLLQGIAPIADTWYDFAVGLYTQSSFSTGTTWFSEPTATRMNAGELTVDGTVTAKALAALIVLTSEIIAGNPNGTHARMTPNGFRVMAAGIDGGTPTEVIRLGTDTDDYLGVVNALGELVASISSSGGMTAQSLDVAGDISMGGTTLAETLDARPKGLIAWASRWTAGKYWAGATSHPYLHLTFPVEAGRAYMVRTNSIGMDGSSTSSDPLVRLHQIQGDNCTTTAPVIAQAISTSSGIATYRSSITINRILTPSSTENLSVLLAYGAARGTGKISAPGANPNFLMVEDLGLAMAQTGEWRDGTADNSTVDPTPPATVQNYDQTWNATGTRSFLGSGGTYSYNTGYMYSGLQYGTSNGDLSSMAVFPSLTTILNGATVTGVWVYVYYDFWYYGAGGDAYIGLHGQTGLTSSKPAKTYSHAVSTNWPRAAGRWIKMSSSTYDGWRTGQHRGFTLGGSGGGYERYGYAHGAKLRITWTK